MLEILTTSGTSEVYATKVAENLRVVRYSLNTYYAFQAEQGESNGIDDRGNQ